MTTRVQTALLTILLLAPSAAAYAQPAPPAQPARPAQPAPPPTLPTVCTTGMPNVYRICFDGTAWRVTEPTNTRFISRDAVEVRVHHFNFLRFTLSFDVTEEKSEAYQYLNSLWSSILNPNVMQLLGLGGEKPLAAAADPFVTAMREVYRRVSALDRKLADVGGRYSKTGLTFEEAGKLRIDALDAPAGGCTATVLDGSLTDANQDDPLLVNPCSIRALLTSLNAANERLSRVVLRNNDAFVAATTGPLKSLFTTVTDSYAATRKRADLFVSLAEKTVGIETRKAGKHDAGIRVTLKLSAVNEGGGRTPIADVNYFVESTMPLVIHGGVTISKLKDVTFEKIKRVNGFGEDDLFQKKTDDSTPRDFSAFLGWSLFPIGGSTPNTAWGQLLISLGTSVTSPGKTIYAGPSLVLFKRMTFTVGAALSSTSEGELQTLEPDIFKIVKQRPDTAFFFALTSKVH